MEFLLYERGIKKGTPHWLCVAEFKMFGHSGALYKAWRHNEAARTSPDQFVAWSASEDELFRIMEPTYPWTAPAIGTHALIANIWQTTQFVKLAEVTTVEAIVCKARGKIHDTVVIFNLAMPFARFRMIQPPPGADSPPNEREEWQRMREKTLNYIPEKFIVPAERRVLEHFYATVDKTWNWEKSGDPSLDEAVVRPRRAFGEEPVVYRIVK